jgi:predicted Ser/Thr protein kinase
LSYRLHITDKFLGSGQFGVVYKGEYNQSADQWTPVAVKQIFEDSEIDTADAHLTNCLKELGSYF